VTELATARAIAAPAPQLRPDQRIRLGIEVLAAYLAVRRAMAHERLPALVERLRATPPRRRRLPLANPDVDGERLGSAVTRTLVRSGPASRCLVRALVLMRLLAARGVVRGELVITVLPNESTLDAHAWIELDGRPLLAPAPDHERLLVL
jgi:hypothetical protein